MPKGAEQLVVRQHERIHCRLSVRMRIAADAAEQIVLSRSVCNGTGEMEALATDASRGGMGIESSVFVPRGGRLRLQLAGDGPGSPEEEVLVRVQRVSMLNRKPTYYLGVSFTSKGPDHDRIVTAILDAALQQAPRTATGASTVVPSAKGGG